MSRPDRSAFGRVGTAVAGWRDDILGDPWTGGDRHVRALRSHDPGCILARRASFRIRPRRTDARDSGTFEATPRPRGMGILIHRDHATESIPHRRQRSDPSGEWGNRVVVRAG